MEMKRKYQPIEKWVIVAIPKEGGEAKAKSALQPIEGIVLMRNQNFAPVFVSTGVTVLINGAAKTNRIEEDETHVAVAVRVEDIITVVTDRPLVVHPPKAKAVAEPEPVAAAK